MIYDKSSFDYQSNKAELEVMEIYVPMTIRERTAIRSWVKRGHNIGSNPWDKCAHFFLLLGMIVHEIRGKNISFTGISCSSSCQKAPLLLNDNALLYVSKVYFGKV